MNSPYIAHPSDGESSASSQLSGTSLAREPRILRIYRGWAGSGKSTQARADLMRLGYAEYLAEMDSYPGRYLETENGLIFNPEIDQQAVGHWCEALVEQWMQAGIPVIACANTFVRVKYMNPYFNLAMSYQYQVVVIDCTGNYPSLHNPPPDVLQRMKDNWEAWALQSRSPGRKTGLRKPSSPRNMLKAY